jgi:hypothetical protein
VSSLIYICIFYARFLVWRSHVQGLMRPNAATGGGGYLRQTEFAKACPREGSDGLPGFAKKNYAKTVEAKQAFVACR